MNSDVTPKSSTVSKVSGATVIAGQGKGNRVGSTDSGLVPTTHVSGQRIRGQGKGPRHNGRLKYEPRHKKSCLHGF